MVCGVRNRNGEGLRAGRDGDDTGRAGDESGDESREGVAEEDDEESLSSDASDSLWIRLRCTRFAAGREGRGADRT
jgi:hypothetical protein